MNTSTTIDEITTTAATAETAPGTRTRRVAAGLVSLMAIAGAAGAGLPLAGPMPPYIPTDADR